MCVARETVAVEQKPSTIDCDETEAISLHATHKFIINWQTVNKIVVVIWIQSLSATTYSFHLNIYFCFMRCRSSHLPTGVCRLDHRAKWQSVLVANGARAAIFKSFSSAMGNGVCTPALRISFVTAKTSFRRAI